MPKLKWSKEEKKLVVLELLKGGKSVGQISKERGVSEALIYRWETGKFKPSQLALRQMELLKQTLLAKGLLKGKKK